MEETSPGAGPTQSMAVPGKAPGGVLARGAVALAVAAAVGGLVYGMREPEGKPEREAAAAPEAPAVSQPETAATEPEAGSEAGAGGEPGFDLVRVAPDGAALVAGHASPGAKVTIRVDGETFAETEADASGDFVALFDAAPSTDPQAMTLETRTAEGGAEASPDVVVLLPAPDVDATAEQTTRIALAAPGKAATATQDAEALTAEVAGADAAAPTAEADAAAVAATAVLRRDGVEATPTGAGDGLTLASISYGETGLITLAGLGDAGAALRFYVDDRFAQAAEVDPTGRWATELGDVAAGVYRLRIDALGPDGRVASRIETPFQRDFPEPGARPGTITVQPGNNLWTIARIHYGSGVLYTQIHTANRELIRDPELIYPGQIFVLPEPAQTE